MGADPDGAATDGAYVPADGTRSRAAHAEALTMATSEMRGFSTPDETRKFPNGWLEVVGIGGGTVGRLTLQPGWRWSTDVKPTAGTEWCEAPHFQYHLAGRLGIHMSDGTELEAGPGDVTFLPAGHDAWVVGDEPVVVVDWHGATNYAR
jgi:hypothetical protein